MECSNLISDGGLLSQAKEMTASWLTYTVHLQESQIAAAKFTKKVCKCEDKRVATDRALFLFLLLLFKSAFINGWKESCTDPASAKQSTMCKAFFYTFSKAFESLIMVI